VSLHSPLFVKSVDTAPRLERLREPGFQKLSKLCLDFLLRACVRNQSQGGPDQGRFKLFDLVEKREAKALIDVVAIHGRSLYPAGLKRDN